MVSERVFKIKKTLDPENPLDTGSRNSENLELPVVGHTITTLTPSSKTLNPLYLGKLVRGSRDRIHRDECASKHVQRLGDYIFLLAAATQF